MVNNEIMEYYDHLMRIAITKCGSQTDAEDLVSDTFLAAFNFLNNGGNIEYPKTWLTNTLFHKYNDTLRKKYRSPVTVCLDDCFNIAENTYEEHISSDEASRVRKELNFLGFITREVMLRFYFGGQSISDISCGLNIPEGTVKSRLAAGRIQMKKGLEAMETRENHLPGKLYLSFGGFEGVYGEPMSLVEDDLIAQNLLILAYERPVTVSELSRAIGIPAAYIEPIIKKLTSGELMVQTDSGKVYTDFLITDSRDSLKLFKPQLEFAHRHFDVIWDIIGDMSKKLFELPFVRKLNENERTKLDRYAILKALQDFQHFGIHKIESPKFPNRRDGGRWTAQATVFEAGFNTKEYREASEYMIHGGHRTTEDNVSGKRIRLYEFDTTLWDSPNRFGFSYELYFKYIIRFLHNIHTDIPLDKSDIPNQLICAVPTLEELGLIKSSDNRIATAIPVLQKSEYDDMCIIIKCATEKIKCAVGDEFSNFTRSMKTHIPKHLTSVPELFRYSDATKYFVMAVVREAYEKGLHLKNVDYCCPPVVMVYGY